MTDSSATGDMPEAAGDGGGQGSMGAIILDGYKRAFAIDLAKGFARPKRASRWSVR